MHIDGVYAAAAAVLLCAVYTYHERALFWVGELRVAWSGLVLSKSAVAKNEDTPPIQQ